MWSICTYASYDVNRCSGCVNHHFVLFAISGLRQHRRCPTNHLETKIIVVLCANCTVKWRREMNVRKGLAKATVLYSISAICLSIENMQHKKVINIDQKPIQNFLYSCGCV